MAGPMRMPARRAATRIQADARRRTPKTVLPSTSATIAASASAIGRPTCRGVSASALSSGSLVASGISDDSGSDAGRHRLAQQGLGLHRAVDHPDGDEREQQRADDLVGAGLDLEPAGDAAPRAAGRRGEHAARRTTAPAGRPRRCRGLHGGGDAAERDLALAADVGEVGALGRTKPRPTRPSARARLIEAAMA